MLSIFAAAGTVMVAVTAVHVSLPVPSHTPLPFPFPAPVPSQTPVPLPVPSHTPLPLRSRHRGRAVAHTGTVAGTVTHAVTIPVPAPRQEPSQISVLLQDPSHAPLPFPVLETAAGSVSAASSRMLCLASWNSARRSFSAQFRRRSCRFRPALPALLPASCRLPRCGLGRRLVRSLRKSRNGKRTAHKHSGCGYKQNF